MGEPRRLIICCDGTWNTADQDHDGVPTPTNVRLFHNIVADSGLDGRGQVKRYFSGVGADGRWISRAIDGGVGRGLSVNIRNAYTWLAGNYREGDRLCLVGFSRGAFTVRSLVGMIRAAGLLDLCSSVYGDAAARSKAVQAAFDRYRDSDSTTWPGDHRFHEGLRPEDTARRDADPGVFIEFLGVWDTVGALGVPDSLPVVNLLDDPCRYAFHDTELAPEVGAARHAMALDERRGPFVPGPWTRDVDGRRETLPNDEWVTQLWFPGAHSDVGGGYAEHGLSDGALRWMIDEAAASTPLGVRWQAVDQLQPDPLDVLHDSCTGIYERMSSAPRHVPRIDSSELVHQSAATRSTGSPVRQGPYRPTSVVPALGAACEVLARVPWSETGLWLEPGSYTFKAAGDWTDGMTAADPCGIADESLFHHVRGLVGRLERWANGSDGGAEVPTTKRWEEAAWMELIGVVAHGAGHLVDAEEPRHPRTKEGPDGHQWIRIGAEATNVQVPRAGYLYAFANDAWGFYGNNRGSVRLTVTRVDLESSPAEEPVSARQVESPSPS